MTSALIAAAALAAATPATFHDDGSAPSPVTAELVVPAGDYAFVPRREWDEITNRVEVLYAEHTNRVARVAAAKARREETLKAAKAAAARRPWRAPKIPNRAPHFQGRPK